MTPIDHDAYEVLTDAIYQSVRPYTMTSAERVVSLCDAVRHITLHDIPGDIVECGVWRGGSMMAVAKCLLAFGALRTLRLFDTFAGMPLPSTCDVDFRGSPAIDMLQSSDKQTADVWALSPLEDVRRNMAATRYPERNIVYVEGRVEETIPRCAPDHIALLRLDTDWYESTAHELKHLFPLLSVGGILIIDDYGHWQGARRAVDEYFAAERCPVFLSRIDYTGRLAIKTATGVSGAN
jgi:O-methyltransferase